MPDLRRIMRRCSADPFCRMLVQMAQDAAEPLYLVGGALRDMLLGRPVRDWDFAGAGAMEFAAKFADAQASKVIVLHEEQPTARVPLRPARSLAKGGEDDEAYTLFDFCHLRSNSIEEDLAARDFSINAIAYNLAEPELIDPLGGIDDIRSSIIRALGQENLRADPLRCLRAYRLAAELGFTIEERTRA